MTSHKQRTARQRLAVRIGAVAVALVTATAVASAAAGATGEGYVLMGSNGAVYGGYGNLPYYGACTTPSLHCTGNHFVSIAATTVNNGYWLLSNTGAIFAFGGAPYEGGCNTPSVGCGVITNFMGLVGAPTNGGYLEVTSRGAVYGLGTGNDYYAGGCINAGSGCTTVTNIVGVTGTSTGNGYWMVSSTGAVFAFSRTATHPVAHYLGGCNVPTSGCAGIHDIVGIVATATNLGYWEVGSDGGVFAFGDAPFKGSYGGQFVTGTSVVGMARTPDSQGYWLVRSFGQLLTFGDAAQLNAPDYFSLSKPIVGMAP